MLLQKISSAEELVGEEGAGVTGNSEKLENFGNCFAMGNAQKQYHCYRRGWKQGSICVHL